MENVHEYPGLHERTPKIQRSGWHVRRAELLALALILPLPAFAKEQEEVRSPAQIERVEEDRGAFFERLQDAARTRTNETSWAHFSSPDGVEVSVYSAIDGTEESTSVYVDLREASVRALAGDEVILCHTHPQRQPEEIPHPIPLGRPLPIDAPSRDDIESYLFRLSLLSRLTSSEDVSFTALQRFQDCVMTTNGGYWQLEAVELDLMRSRIAEIENHAGVVFDEAIAVIDAHVKSPEFLELLEHLTPEKFKGEPIENRILEFAYTADTKAPDHGFSPELVRFIHAIREHKRGLLDEAGSVRINEFSTRFFDRERTPQQHEEDLTAYLSYVRAEFGIKITWHTFPRDEEY